MEETVFETEWFSVARDQFNEVPSLGGKPYYWLNSPDSVVILPLTDAREVVMVRQFRPALREWTLEVPAGGVEPNEDPEDAARRELWEETGFSCRELIPLPYLHLMASRLNSKQYAYVALGATRDDRAAEYEEIGVEVFDLPTLKRLVTEGSIRQVTMLALLQQAEWVAGIKLDGLTPER